MSDDQNAETVPTAPTGNAESDLLSAGQSLALEQARLAYSIIQSLLEHTRVTSDLVALMAQVIDEDTTKALIATPYWTAYLDSRRAMERTRKDIEKFAEEWTGMSGTSEASEASGASEASEASGASEASEASGASGASEVR